MIGLLGEGSSDTKMIQCLIRRITDNQRIRIETMGCGSKGNLLKKGLRFINACKDQGLKYFVVCMDADGSDPEPARQAILERVIYPAQVDAQSCCVVPVQEIEAWILADLSAVTKVFTSWKPKPHKNPEGQANPKEYLESLSKADNKRPRYSHQVHNEHVAKHLELSKVYQACPSFRPFQDFIEERLK